MTAAHTESTRSFVIVNPATGREVTTYAAHSDDDVLGILEDVGKAQRKWESTSVSERAGHLREVAVHLRQTSRELALAMATEMGKPITQGVAEIEKCAANCEFYADQGESLIADELLQVPGSRTHYQPLGAVLAVMPWNFPFWQVLRCAAPILMAGNAMVLKHASNVMGCALLIERILADAGLPTNVFRTLKIWPEQVESVIQHPAISAVTLTGSERAGRAVAGAAGAALKPCVLELGGSDPFIVLDDADLQQAARTGAWARNQNAGQSCIAAKRFIVVDAIHDKYVELLTEHVRALKMGDPSEKETEIGPMARFDLRDELHRQVVDSVNAGATVVLGGEVPQTPGVYYPATVITRVRPGIPVFDEETFGPVAAITRVRDEAEAIEAANNSRFGLGSSIWTTNRERAMRVATQIEAGMVFVNSITRSDSRLPFGGVKASGFGRELWLPGIRTFTNVKTISLG